MFLQTHWTIFLFTSFINHLLLNITDIQTSHRNISIQHLLLQNRLELKTRSNPLWFTTNMIIMDNIDIDIVRLTFLIMISRTTLCSIKNVNYLLIFIFSKLINIIQLLLVLLNSLSLSMFLLLTILLFILYNVFLITILLSSTVKYIMIHCFQLIEVSLQPDLLLIYFHLISDHL